MKAGDSRIDKLWRYSFGVNFKRARVSRGGLRRLIPSMLIPPCPPMIRRQSRPRACSSPEPGCKYRSPRSKSFQPRFPHTGAEKIFRLHDDRRARRERQSPLEQNQEVIFRGHHARFRISITGNFPRGKRRNSEIGIVSPILFPPILFQPFVEPADHGLVPEDGVGRFEDPVILVGKIRGTCSRCRAAVER